MKSILIGTLFCVHALAQDSSTNTIAALGYLYPEPVTVAPGQVITVYIQGTVTNDVSVTVRQTSDYPAPILNIRPPIACAGLQSPCLTAITIQIPLEVQPTCFICAAAPASIAAPFPTTLVVTVDGVAGPPFFLTPLADRIHFLTTCDTVVSGGSGSAPVNGLPCAPFVTHGDGSLVTSQSPAHAEEEIVAYAVGLGATNPAVATGQAAASPIPTQQRFPVDFNYHRNALASKPVPPLPGEALTRYAVPLFSGLTAGYVGLYQVNFVVAPPSTDIVPCGPSIESNLTVSMAGQFSFDGVGICVAP